MATVRSGWRVLHPERVAIKSVNIAKLMVIALATRGSGNNNCRDFEININEG
jgi:hypothetical protein